MRPHSRAVFWLSLSALVVGLVFGCGGSSSKRSSVGSTSAPSSAANFGFQNAGPLNQARAHHSATLLNDGRILVAGGLVSPTQATSSVEILDPVTGRSVFTTPMTTPRMHHVAILLPTHKVLVIGGQSDRFGQALRSIEVYDPASDSWSAGPDLTVPRSQAQAALFQGGKKVLIAGGADLTTGNPTVHGSADIYDADANTVSPSTSPLASPRCCGVAVAQPNGSILLASGYSSITTSTPAPPETYDPLTDQFVATTPMVTPRADAAVVELPDGVHTISGVDGAHAILTSAERFDGQGWASWPGVRHGRTGHTATPLNNEAVVIGGRDGGIFPGEVEHYAPPANTAPVGSSSTAPTGSGTVLGEARYAHTATRVNDRIYVIGGFADNDDLLASVEVYAAKGSVVPGAGAPLGARAPGQAPSSPLPTPVAPGGITVAQIAPTQGDVGDQVQVLGMGFDPNTAGNVVRFNGIQAVVTRVDVTNPSAQVIDCVVPNGATTGALTVEVNGALGVGPVFTVGASTSNPGSLPPPQVFIVFPNAARSFIPVSLTGRDFGPQPVVTFNGVPTINIVNWRSSSLPILGRVTELIVMVPPGATSGPLIVSNGSAQSAPFYFTVR